MRPSGPRRPVTSRDVWVTLAAFLVFVSANVAIMQLAPMGWAAGLLTLMIVAYLMVLEWPERMRRRRERGGLCVSCGYDRSGLGIGAACPECGAGG